MGSFTELFSNPERDHSKSGNLVSAIQDLAKKLPLEKHYIWEVPGNAPIDIPPRSAYEDNIYLKENFAKALAGDDNLEKHYWVIRDWGGIKTFQQNRQNNQKIREFKEQLNNKRLTRPIFNLISSLSKLAAFLHPKEYSIYDSRAVFSLNWLIFRHTNHRKLFPQPLGRSSVISKYDTFTLFRLSGVDFDLRDWQTAYHNYCDLLKYLAREAFNTNRPYDVEMLLFTAAPEVIIDDIRNNVKVSINLDS